MDFQHTQTPSSNSSTTSNAMTLETALLAENHWLQIENQELRQKIDRLEKAQRDDGLRYAYLYEMLSRYKEFLGSTERPQVEDCTPTGQREPTTSAHHTAKHERSKSLNDKPEITLLNTSDLVSGHDIDVKDVIATATWTLENGESQGEIYRLSFIMMCYKRAAEELDRAVYQLRGDQIRTLQELEWTKWQLVELQEFTASGRLGDPSGW